MQLASAVIVKFPVVAAAHLQSAEAHRFAYAFDPLTDAHIVALEYIKCKKKIFLKEAPAFNYGKFFPFNIFNLPAH